MKVSYNSGFHSGWSEKSKPFCQILTCHHGQGTSRSKSYRLLKLWYSQATKYSFNYKLTTLCGKTSVRQPLAQGPSWQILVGMFAHWQLAELSINSAPRVDVMWTSMAAFWCVGNTEYTHRLCLNSHTHSLLTTHYIVWEIGFGELLSALTDKLKFKVEVALQMASKHRIIITCQTDVRVG